MNELSIYLILSRKYLLPDAVLGSLFTHSAENTPADKTCMKKGNTPQRAWGNGVDKGLQTLSGELAFPHSPYAKM